MKIENLSEKNVLKLVVVTLLSIMLLTTAVVLSFNMDTLKQNFFDKQVKILTVIPENEENILRVVFTGVSSPLTPHIAQQSVVLSINNKTMYLMQARDLQLILYPKERWMQRLLKQFSLRIHIQII